MHRKSQLKMFETIAVLIVFFILLTIGMAIYFTLQKSQGKQELEQQRQLRAQSIVQRMLYLPELDCNFVQSTTDNCFEFHKLKALQEVLNTPTTAIDYFPLFGYSTITIHLIYPTQLNIVLYRHEPGQIQRTFATQNPVIIRNTLTDTNAFGYVEITSYAQT